MNQVATVLCIPNKHECVAHPKFTVWMLLFSENNLRSFYDITLQL